tara:strand:+ start:302 stop:940 length:639 start_codon:yes stop_codon:yes gene_type:complete
MAKLRGEQTTSKYTIKQAEKTIIDKGGKSLLAKIKKEATNLNNEPEKWKKIEKELISLGKAYGQNFIYNSEQSNRAWKKVSAQKITGTAKDPCPVPSWLSDKEKEIFNNHLVGFFAPILEMGMDLGDAQEKGLVRRKGKLVQSKGANQFLVKIIRLLLRHRCNLSQACNVLAVLFPRYVPNFFHEGTSNAENFRARFDSTIKNRNYAATLSN